METTKALLLLAKVSDDPNEVLSIARDYVADMLRAYHSVEDYALMKDGTVTPFADIDEFAQLRKNVAKIESATKVIDEFFMIEDDIDKLRNYSDMGMLVFYEEPVEEVQEVKAPEPEPVKKTEPKVEHHEEETSAHKFSAPKFSAPKFSAPKFGSNDKEESEPEKKTEPKKEEAKKPEPKKETKKPEPVVEEAPVEEEHKDFVGITKVDAEEGVKAMVGSAYGDAYENPYDVVYDDDAALEESVPKAVKLFDGPEKTEDDEVIAEARMIIDEGTDFICTASNPNVYLNKRMEYYRIKYALKNIDDGGEPEPEVEIIKGEITKLRGFDSRGEIVSVAVIEYDLNLVEKVYGLLKDFDGRLYKPEDLPKIDRMRELMDDNGSYDEKSSLVTRFYKFDVAKFLKTVYDACSNLELDKKKRFDIESAKVEDKYFELLRDAEREAYKQKQGLKSLLGSGKNNITAKKKELDDAKRRELDELEREISEIVEKDKKMVGENMKLYARIDNILKNNVLSMKAK